MTSCGTNITKPDEIEPCAEVSSCFNGIKDGNETGLDCGGGCKPCAAKESPAAISNFMNTTILISIFFVLMTILAVGYTFRKQISRFMSGLKRKERKKKATYLKDD